MLVEITGEPAFDAIAALAVAVAIVFAGIRILTRSGAGPRRRGAAGRGARPDRGRDRRRARADPEIAGYHKLRARRAARARYIDFHLQFRTGTSLERAHEHAHGSARRSRPAIPTPRC